MRASELRDFGVVQELASGTWADYAKGFFAVEVTGENDGKKLYSVMTRKTPALTYIVGLRELNEGFSILFNLDGEQHRLVIDSALVAGPRRDEIRMLCTEFEE